MENTLTPESKHVAVTARELVEAFLWSDNGVDIPERSVVEDLISRVESYGSACRREGIEMAARVIDCEGLMDNHDFHFSDKIRALLEKT